MAREIRIPVRTDTDATRVLLHTVEQAKQAGFNEVGQQMIATAASELARNLLRHAGSGDIVLRILDEQGRQGIEIQARDRGPGIADVESAMSDHFSTAGTLGLGLPGVRRLMDEFEMESTVGVGTCVTAKKFL